MSRHDRGKVPQSNTFKCVSNCYSLCILLLDLMYSTLCTELRLILDERVIGAYLPLQLLDVPCVQNRIRVHDLFNHTPAIISGSSTTQKQRRCGCNNMFTRGSQSEQFVLVTGDCFVIPVICWSYLLPQASFSFQLCDMSAIVPLVSLVFIAVTLERFSTVCHCFTTSLFSLHRRHAWALLNCLPLLYH